MLSAELIDPLVLEFSIDSELRVNLNKLRYNHIFHDVKVTFQNDVKSTTCSVILALISDSAMMMLSHTPQAHFDMKHISEKHFNMVLDLWLTGRCARPTMPEALLMLAFMDRDLISAPLTSSMGAYVRTKMDAAGCMAYFSNHKMGDAGAGLMKDLNDFMCSFLLAHFDEIDKKKLVQLDDTWKRFILENSHFIETFDNKATDNILTALTPPADETITPVEMQPDAMQIDETEHSGSRVVPGAFESSLRVTDHRYWFTYPREDGEEIRVMPEASNAGRGFKSQIQFMERYGDDALILAHYGGTNVFVFGLTDLTVLNSKHFDYDPNIDVCVKKDAVILKRTNEIQCFTRTPPGQTGFLETIEQSIILPGVTCIARECEDNMLLACSKRVITVFRKNITNEYESTRTITPESDPRTTVDIKQIRFVNGHTLVGYVNENPHGYAFKIFNEDGDPVWTKLMKNHQYIWHDVFVHEHLVFFSFSSQPDNPAFVTVSILNTHNFKSDCQEHNVKFAMGNYTIYQKHSVKFVMNGSNILVCHTENTLHVGIEVYAFNLRTQAMNSLCSVPKFISDDLINTVVSLPGILCLFGEKDHSVTVFRRT
jgi:hypothetical protein